MYKQIIIARKDLEMSPGKLAAQVSHASMSFLAWMVRDNTQVNLMQSDPMRIYRTGFYIDKNLFEQWLNGSFTKVVLQAKNRTQLLKAVKMAQDLGMTEGADYFIIRDACRTELKPEEDGSTITCIGFKPMPEELIDQIGKKFHIYEA